MHIAIKRQAPLNKSRTIFDVCGLFRRRLIDDSQHEWQPISALCCVCPIFSASHAFPYFIQAYFLNIYYVLGFVVGARNKNRKSPCPQGIYLVVKGHLPNTESSLQLHKVGAVILSTWQIKKLRQTEVVQGLSFGRLPAGGQGFSHILPGYHPKHNATLTKESVPDLLVDTL